ncbi:MAG: DUF4336 domain-containing protein [Pseudomonadales bacterium]
MTTSLKEYVPGWIWLKEYPIRYAGCRFNARMAVIRLSDGSLIVHSPCPLDATTKAEIDALGRVGAIVAPGNYHYLNVRAFADAFPDAQVFVCPGVEKKDRTLANARLLSDTPDSIWSADIDQVLIRGSRFIHEVAFFHRPTRTLIVVDVIENYGDKTTEANWVLRFWWKYVFRMWNRPMPAPEYQLGWNDKAAAKESLERVLAWDFARIVISHGDLIERDAPQVARDAWQAILQAPSGHPSGYNAAQRIQLLKDFDRTCALMDESLRAKYGAANAQQMYAKVRDEYNLLIPEIPRISGSRARMLNQFLIITAQELAAYKGLKKLDMPVEDIWQLCHKAIRLRANTVPKWKRWLLKQVMFSKLLSKVMARRAALRQIGRFGEFEIEYLDADREDFDLGINYRGCGNYNFVMKHGGAEFAPYICMSDIALSEAFGWGLVRTQTLADGCDHCDFRMNKDGPTQISSKTPRVQQVIELISAQELRPS